MARSPWVFAARGERAGRSTSLAMLLQVRPMRPRRIHGHRQSEKTGTCAPRCDVLRLWSELLKAIAM
jgi:hypothetical protein